LLLTFDLTRIAIGREQVQYPAGAPLSAPQKGQHMSNFQHSARLALSDSASVRYCDIRATAAAYRQDIDTFPYVIRVLMENLCRNRIWGKGVAQADIAAVMDWRNRMDADLPLYVARVILPDSSGLPVLQDLAAVRDAVASAGGDPAGVDVKLPIDLIVDHSLQVDFWGNSQALVQNLNREFERNAERYRFLKWAQQAFRGLRVFPPGTGIIHQVNLEHIAPVVASAEQDGERWVFPDFVLGGDSHTPMINALGVLGWGVGGIDAEAAVLGHAYTFPIPEVVGVRLTGKLDPLAYTTDAALLINQTLRQAGVANCAVEFFGPAVAQLSVPERATIANMAPEYGATCGFFPVDERTLAYLRASGRSASQVDLVAAYCRQNAFFRADCNETPAYSRIIDIDLAAARASLAGPRRPQDRMPVQSVAADFKARLDRPLAEGGFAVTANTAPATPANEAQRLRHGAVVIASITSCTNTSNPSVMLAAGLVAKKAVERGLATPAWVKTSLAPGSRAVERYLQAAGLLEPLEKLGFNVIGYGCTTCAGKSGSLADDVVQQIQDGELVAAAVLSGNRNFEGRIHKLVRANYIGAPPLVVLYALAGRIDIDLEREPIGMGLAPDGAPVFMRDLLPDSGEIEALLPLANNAAIFDGIYDGAGREGTWQALPAPTGPRFAWDLKSTYLVEPPFFSRDSGASDLAALDAGLRDARVLAAFGDSLTTDHISPGGEIPVETPAGQYLLAAGVKPRDFNSYVARRCNYHVMARATFANIRIRNMLVPEREGGYTRHFPDGTVATIFDTATAYQKAGVPAIILAGREYGTGSSRDWAAKGSMLLGVKAVIAESYERIHRANLVGMGVLPLAFAAGEGWRALGLTGEERFDFDGVKEGVLQGKPITVTATAGERKKRFQVIAQVLTLAEQQLMVKGGIPCAVLDEFTRLPRGQRAPLA